MLLLNELHAILHGILSDANIRFLHDIIRCFYCVQKNITVRGLSRYSAYDKRSFFRFLGANVDWVSLRLALLRRFVVTTGPSGPYILALDETVEGKSRKRTHGMGKFYSSTLEKAIGGICFSALSLIDTSRASSYLLGVEQLVHTEADKQRIAAQKQLKAAAGAGTVETKSKGRPAGSKNKQRAAPDNASFRAFKALLDAVVPKLPPLGIQVCYLVADSAFSALHHVEEVRRHGLHLISKLAHNTALYKPRAKLRGKGLVVGERLNLYDLPKEYLKETRKEDGRTVLVYQFEALNPSLKGCILNIVVIQTAAKSGEVGIKILVSTDLGLAHDLVEKYYHLRFQIEFDFDLAKHSFGLSSFKNFKEKNVTNFSNIVFFMCTYNQVALERERINTGNPNLSVNDLKIIQNYRYIAKDAINKVRKSPTLIFNNAFWDNYQPEMIINRA